MLSFWGGGRQEAGSWTPSPFRSLLGAPRDTNTIWSTQTQGAQRQLYDKPWNALTRIRIKQPKDFFFLFCSQIFTLQQFPATATNEVWICCDLRHSWCSCTPDSAPEAGEPALLSWYQAPHTAISCRTQQPSPGHCFQWLLSCCQYLHILKAQLMERFLIVVSCQFMPRWNHSHRSHEAT